MNTRRRKAAEDPQTTPLSQERANARGSRKPPRTGAAPASVPLSRRGPGACAPRPSTASPFAVDRNFAQGRVPPPRNQDFATVRAADDTRHNLFERAPAGVSTADAAARSRDRRRQAATSTALPPARRAAAAPLTGPQRGPQVDEDPDDGKVFAGPTGAAASSDSDMSDAPPRATDADANAAMASASDVSSDASNEEAPLEPAGSDPAAPEMARRGTESWALEAFLAKRGVDDLLNGTTAAKRAAILRDLGNIENEFGGPTYVESGEKQKWFAAVLVLHGIPLALLNFVDKSLLNPRVRAVLVKHYAPKNQFPGPKIPQKHACIEFHMLTMFRHVGLDPNEFAGYLLLVDAHFIQCSTTDRSTDGQKNARKVTQSIDAVLAGAGLDPAWARAAHVDIVKTMMKEGKYAGKKIWVAGGAALRWAKENLPENPLGDPLMHAQAAIDMQANVARSILDGKTDETTSWNIPGPKLRASSDRGASQLMLAVAGDDQKIRKVTIYKDIYLGDAAANDAVCQMRKDKFARKTHAQKADFFARMDHIIYFLDLFDALDALGDRAPADVLAAAKRIAAAKGWLRPALAAADGGVVAAVAPHAAVAMPRLRAVDAMPRLRAVDASRGSASDSAARVAVAPEPDAIVVDAPTIHTVAPTPSLAADDNSGDDPFDCVLFDPADFDDSPDARGSTNASDWASVEAWLNKRNPETFDAALKAAQKRAGLLKKARYAALPERIALGARLGWLDAAAAAASLSKEGGPVTEADVRGGAARPLLPVCERRPPSPRAREVVVRNTASRRSATRPCSGVSRERRCSARSTPGSSPTSP